VSPVVQENKQRALQSQKCVVPGCNLVLSSQRPTDLALSSWSRPTDLAWSSQSPTDLAWSSQSPTDLAWSSQSPTDLAWSSQSPTDLAWSSQKHTDFAWSLIMSCRQDLCPCELKARSVGLWSSAPGKIWVFWAQGKIHGSLWAQGKIHGSLWAWGKICWCRSPIVTAMKLRYCLSLILALTPPLQCALGGLKDGGGGVKEEGHWPGSHLPLASTGGGGRGPTRVIEYPSSLVPCL